MASVACRPRAAGRDGKPAGQRSSRRRSVVAHDDIEPCSRQSLGDEGSGFWIGQEALRAGFWAKDRDVSTNLLTEIGEFWGAKSLGEIVEMANARPGPDFPALAPVVVRCAEAGD